MGHFRLASGARVRLRKKQARRVPVGQNPSPDSAPDVATLFSSGGPGQGLQRDAKMASLAKLKAECAAAFELLRAVDPFCDGLDAELAAAGEHASHERVFAGGFSE